MVTTEDRQRIAETLALQAYIVDENRLERLGELFVPEAVYDMSAVGMGVFEGIEVIGAAAARLNASGRGPTAHFVTNILVTDGGEDEAVVRSRGLMIMHDGSVQGVTYDDTLRRRDGRWLIARRSITPVEPSPGVNEPR